jgi:putative hydrolase of the HAD superfamily
VPSSPSPSFVSVVLWDFGGVILTSPFEAFSRYEASAGLPVGLIRSINSTNPDTNAWAQFERSDVDLDGFCELFEAEALAVGHRVDAHAIMALLHGEVRPQMIAALNRIKEAGLRQALLTNNVVTGSHRQGTGGRDEVLSLFDAIVESSVVGVRKPETRFYEIACELLNISPSDAVFLDDLGINLKPAAALGMRTIKVVDPDVALDQLSEILGFRLR